MERGFKSGCESLATDTRSEIGLDDKAPLDPRQLADHLGIPIHPVSGLRGTKVSEAIRHVTEVDQGVLSAMTIFPDWPRRRRVIIYNDSNSPGRQSSDLAHELAHGILLHEPRAAIVKGRRDLAAEDEKEANWLAGCLLVPRPAALAVALAGQPLEDAAEVYGVSTEMMRYRVHSTGAKRRVDARRAGRGQRSSPRPRA